MTRAANLEADVHGDGPPVVLLHGQPGSASDWSRVVPLLSRDRTVVVPDRPGYGRTGGKATGFAGNASALHDALGALGLRPATLVGHSWGGGVAIATAIDRPSAVRSLVLVGSVRPGESLGFVDRMLASPGLGEALAALTIGATAVVLGNRRVRDLVERRLDGRTRDAVHALEGVTGARTRAPVWRSFVSEQRRLFDELDGFTTRLGEISVPTVVLSGGADRIVPAEVGERLAESIPGAVHRVVPDARHLLAFDHPDEIVAAVSEAEARAGEPAG